MQYGMKVRIRFNRDSMYVTGIAPDGTILIDDSPPLENGDTDYLRNVTKIHFGYESILLDQTRIAFESNIHRTGVTHNMADIAEFETTLETEKAEHF